MIDVTNWTDETMEGGEDLSRNLTELQRSTGHDKSTDDMINEIYNTMHGNKTPDYSNYSKGLNGVVTSMVSNYTNIASSDPTKRAIGYIGVITSVGELASLAGPEGIIVAGLFTAMGTLLTGILKHGSSLPVPPSPISQVLLIVSAAEDEVIHSKLAKETDVVTSQVGILRTRINTAIANKSTVVIGDEWVNPKATLVSTVETELTNRVNGVMGGVTGKWHFSQQGANYLYSCAVLASHLRELLTLCMWANIHNQGHDPSKKVFYGNLKTAWSDLDEKIKMMMDHFRFPHGTKANMDFYKACWQLSRRNKRIISSLGATVDMPLCGTTVRLENQRGGFAFSDFGTENDYVIMNYDIKGYPAETIFQLIPCDRKSPIEFRYHYAPQQILIFSMGSVGYLKAWLEPRTPNGYHLSPVIVGDVRNIELQNMGSQCRFTLTLDAPTELKYTITNVEHGQLYHLNVLKPPRDSFHEKPLLAYQNDGSENNELQTWTIHMH